MIGPVIYLTGAVAAYWRMRKSLINEHKGDSWDRVFICFLCASMSWIGLILAVMQNSKPPKWL